FPWAMTPDRSRSSDKRPGQRIEMTRGNAPSVAARKSKVREPRAGRRAERRRRPDDGCLPRSVCLQRVLPVSLSSSRCGPASPYRQYDPFACDPYHGPWFPALLRKSHGRQPPTIPPAGSRGATFVTTDLLSRGVYPQEEILPQAGASVEAGLMF